MTGNTKKRKKIVTSLNCAIATLLANIAPDTARSIDLNSKADMSVKTNVDQEDEENNSLILESSDSVTEESNKASYHYSHRSHSSHSSHRSHYSGR